MDVKKLSEMIKEGVEATVSKKASEELIDAIAETIEEKCEIKKTEAKKLIAHAYEMKYNTEKFEEKREKIEELYSNLDSVEV